MIGEVIREARKAKGLSHQKLAEATGFSKRSIIYWETGERSISVENADTLLKTLGITLTIG